jgi:hypothetical protein
VGPRPPVSPRPSSLRAEAFEGGLDLRDRSSVWRRFPADKPLKLRTRYAADACDSFNSGRQHCRAQGFKPLFRSTIFEDVGRPEHLGREVLVGVGGINGDFFSDARPQLYVDAANPASGDAPGDRRLDERAFLLWWSGRPIVHDVRQLLLRLARGMIDAVERVRAYQPTQIVGSDFRDGKDPAFDTADAYFQEHPPESLKGKRVKAMFANLAHKGVDVQSVMIAMFTAALGGMMTFEGSHDKDEPSLTVLVLRAFGFTEFSVDATPEEQVTGMTKSVRFFANHAQVMAFTGSLSDEELDIARKCARAMFEGLPEIFEMQAICFGKRAPARILRAFSSMATTHFKATSIIAMAWLLRREGAANALRLVSQIEEALPKAQAMSKLAKAFPQYRKEFLTKNAAQMAALPEETAQQNAGYSQARDVLITQRCPRPASTSRERRNNTEQLSHLARHPRAV